jgi:hypothetical protein
MLNRVKDGIRAAHPMVWFSLVFVALALAAVVGWDAYQAAHKPPRASAISVVQPG